MKQLETERLFYDKYMYKVCIYLPIASIFREKRYDHTRSVLDDLHQQLENTGEIFWKRGWRLSAPLNVDVLKDAQLLYTLLIKQDFESYKLRVEQSQLCYYTNDIKNVESLLVHFDKRIESVHMPNSDNIKDLKPNVIIKDSDWEYKVTVGPKVDPSLADWFENNKDKVKAGKTFIECIRNGHYVRGFYFYAKNEKVLQLINIVLAGNIVRVDKFINKAQS